MRVETFYDGDIGEYRSKKTFSSNSARFSVAIGFRASSNFYNEIELSFSQNTPPIEHYSVIRRESNLFNNMFTFVGLNYEINRQLLQEGRFTFFSGVGLNSHYSNSRREPRDTNSHLIPVTENNIGTSLTVVPRINFAISQKLSFEINSKLAVLNINWKKSIFENPAIPASDQTKWEKPKWTFFPYSYNLRLGLVYQIKDSNKP